MGDWGIKISETGYDVKTATNRQLVLSSGLNAIKIKTVGVWSTGDADPAHGLSYTPAFFYICELDSSSKYGIMGQNYYGNFPIMTDTYLYLGGKTKYFILYQEGATA